MEKKYVQVKNNIVLILSIMMFMFTLCFVLYSAMNKDNNMNINTSIELEDGNDVISQNLQSVIPTSIKVDKSINTAYQNNVVTYKEIDNDIYLLKAYKLSNNYSYKDMNSILKKLYGNNLFIINNSFNVNGTDKCVYDNLLKIYNCKTVDYTGILYNTYRKILGVSINNNDYYLNESVVFYSIDNTDKDIKYSIYTDSTYSSLVNSFTASEITQDTTIEEYIEANYINNANLYRSKFLLVKNNYQWINTERLK